MNENNNAIDFVNYVFKYERIDCSMHGSILLDGYCYGSKEFEEALLRIHDEFKNQKAPERALSD